MKKNLLFWLVITAFLFSFSLTERVDAFVLDNPAAGIEFWIPDGWPHHTEGPDLMVDSPDKELSLVMTVLEADDLESALTECMQKIQEGVGEFHLDDPQELEINGMKMLDFDGYAMNGAMKLSVSLMLTPTEKIFTIFSFATEASIKRHEKQLIQIVQGLKPRSSGGSAMGGFASKAGSGKKSAPAPVKYSPPPPSAPAEFAPWAVGDSVYLDGNQVSLRSEPNTRSKILATLSMEDLGEVVAVGPKENIAKLGSYYWVKVRLANRNGLTGWIFSKFLRGEGCGG